MKKKAVFFTSSDPIKKIGFISIAKRFGANCLLPFINTNSIMKNVHTLLSGLALVFITTFGLTADLSAQTLNDDGNTHTINANGTNLYQGSAQDFTIPANSSYNSISFTLRGGDGGYAKAGADCQSNGGAGAIVTATFWIGPGQNDLNPGGTIRFIVGKRGTDSSVGGTSSCKGGGGGGSAVQYRPPNSSIWYILAVAGAGGGAYQGNIFGGCVDSQKGQGGQTTRWGGNGEGSGAGAGGDNGQGGAQGDSGKGGGGAITAGGGEGGGAGGDEGGEGSNPPSPGNPGGWGYGGGGGGGEGGSGGAPGGGGYSGGGGGGVADNGGGGGSYVNPTRSFSSSKTEGEKGGGNSQNGYISYSFINTVITWTGAVDHDWHNSGNWSPARVPGSNDIVEINAAANDPYIWTTADAGSVKVFSGGELTIQPNATLNLSPTNGFSGIFNFGTVTNDNGILNISSTGNSAVDGILNSGSTFTNKFGGTINIEGMDRHGIFNTSNANFTNQAGGTININQTVQDGIQCNGGTFSNNGEIKLGQLANIGNDGISLSGTGNFTNNVSGTISLWGASDEGISVVNTTVFENFGVLNIGGLGGSGIGDMGITSSSTFNNKSGGVIFVDQTTTWGIVTFSGGTINNEGNITIGANAAVGVDGIQNQAVFNNLSSGTIQIDQTGQHGIFNYEGIFTNEGLIKIGENGNIVDRAIFNGDGVNPVFLNSSCSATIHIFDEEIHDPANSFTNTGVILQESAFNSNIETNNGVILYNAGSFTADNGNAPVSVSGSFAGKKIWTGCDGNAWEASVNWAPAGTPTTSDEVIIYSAVTDPVISSSAEAKSVLVEGGHLINNGALAVTDGDLDINLGATVEGNGQYDISSHFTVNGGTFIPGTSTVTMTGTTDDRTIGFDPVTFYNLTIDKPADKAVRIFSIVSVTNEMIINSGDLEVVGVIGGALTCPYLHLPNGTDLFNFDGGNIFLTESGNSFLIQSGASVQGNGFYYIKGDFIVDGGTFTPGTSAVILNGSGNQTISFDPTNFYTLIINKLSGITSLGSGSVTVSNLLNLNHGKLNLNGSDIELIGNGTITGENALNYIYSTNGGVVTKTVDLNAPAAENPGNIGVSITSPANLGTTTIQRGHDVQDVYGQSSILRYYDIAPANNSGLDATVRFSYFDHELNGITESELVPYRFTGTHWEYHTVSASDATANWVETDNVDAFSTWTLVHNPCAANSVIGDDIAPTAQCRDISLNLDANGTPITIAPEDVDNGSFDNCNFTMAIDQTEFGCVQIGAHTVTLTATDESSNSSSCTSTVTVVDDIAPNAMCQSVSQTDQSQLNSQSNQAFSISMGQSFKAGLDGYLSKIRFPIYTRFYNNNITIAPTIEVREGEGLNGNLLSIAPIPVSSTEDTPLQWIEVAFPAPAYVNAGILYTFILNSNPSGQDSITVDDLSVGTRRGLNDPYPDGHVFYDDGSIDSAFDLVFETFVSSSLPITVQLDANGYAQLLASDIDQDSYDNCSDNLSYALSVDEFSCADVGPPIEVTLTVTDESDNPASCTTTVFVTGNQVTCYLDSDGDTYGDPAMAQTFCETCGTGYVLDNTDCDDGDENEFPGQTWYEDADSDGYTTGNTQTACERPLGYRPASELVNTTDIDCDDSDPNVNSCSGLTISGSIIWEHDGVSGVNNATVNVTGAGSGSDVSDTNGDYEVNIPSGTGNFTVKPVKSINKLNGLTSADVTAIQKHVTFIELLPAPFKRIAADVNKSNTITTMDATLINQALLGNPAAMNQITSWRFVPDTYVFPNPNVPWGFPEQINLTGVTGNTSGHDFKGIKLGDVVSTWANPANFGAGEPMVLRVQDQVLQAGQEVSIDFHVDQFTDLNSFQFALYFDPEQLALLEIEPLGGLPVSMGNFGTFNIDGGELRVVWAQASPIMITEAAQLFRLRFQALETGALLRNVLQLNEDVLPAYAYNSAYEESGVQLRFVETSATTNPDQAAGLHLEAWPNPFAESTLLRFNLPQDGEAELRVFDAAGRVLFSKKQYYSAGSYSETFQAEAAPAGVWFAEIRSASGNLVLPLIRVEPK